METVIKNGVANSSSEENYYCWFSYDAIEKVISMYPIGHL